MYKTQSTPFLAKGCTCAVQIYTRYCRHPLSFSSDVTWKFLSFTGQKQTLVNAKFLKIGHNIDHAPATHCQQSMEWRCKNNEKFWNVQEKSTFFFYSLADCANYADFFIPQRYILPLITRIYADIFSCRYILSQIAQITQIFYLRRFKN